MTRRIAVPLLAVAACLAFAAPASAAVTGNYSGETSQDLGLEKPYTTDVVFSVYKGRIVGIVAEVRMLCGESAVMDARVVKSYRTTRGPQLGGKGGFAITVQGVRISGQLGRKAGGGTISASKADCRGSGSWAVKLRQI